MLQNQICVITPVVTILIFDDDLTLNRSVDKTLKKKNNFVLRTKLQPWNLARKNEQ